MIKGWVCWLLVRRSLENPQERAYYLVFALVGTRLAEMVAVAGRRWTVEECLATAQGEVGLDQYAVRSGTGWHRHTPKKEIPRKDPNALIPLSVPEIRHLLWFLVWQKTVEQSLVLAWSLWRRRHQAQAQFYHYQRRLRSG